MAEQKRVVYLQSEKKNGHKPEPKPVSEFAGIAKLTANFLLGSVHADSDVSLASQAARLSDPRLHITQRQMMAARIGQMQGNRHMQRVVTQIVQRRLTAAERAENLRSPQLAGDSRLEAAFDNRPPMSQGERGEAVKKIQQAMIDDGFAMPLSTRRTGSPDGIFRRETERSVEQFQRKHRLARFDGVVGRDTLRAMDALYAGPPGPQPRPSDPHATYVQKLNEAVAMLESVRFGRAIGERVGRDPSDRFDTAFWDEQSDPAYGAMLVLKPGRRPSDAIDAMFAHLGRWHVDCAEFIQIAQWYALRHTYGADDFNRRVARLSFNLRPHGSTGIQTRELYDRDGPSDTMTRSDGQPEPRSIDQLVADAPIGSRVMWTFLGVPTSHDFHHENTIKLGPDLFAAHGFRRTGRNTFTRRDLERLLARTSNRRPTDAYIAENVFIAQIEFYEAP